MEKLNLMQIKPQTPLIKAREQTMFFEKLVLPLFKGLHNVSSNFRLMYEGALTNRDYWLNEEQKAL